MWEKAPETDAGSPQFLLLGEARGVMIFPWEPQSEGGGETQASSGESEVEDMALLFERLKMGLGNREYGSALGAVVFGEVKL